LTREASQHADVEQRGKVVLVPAKRESKRPRSRGMPGRPHMLVPGTQYRKTMLGASPVPSRNFSRAAVDGDSSRQPRRYAVR
jgi:hypothetical protein